MITKMKTQHIIGELYSPQEHVVVTSIADLPEPMTMSAGIIVDDVIYIFGGARYVNDSEEEMISSAFKLDLNKTPLKWEKLKPLPTPRKNHFTVTYDNKIYIVGGVSDAKAAMPITTNVVDIYNIANNTYESKPLVDNLFLGMMTNELFNNRCAACRINKE
jgi:N-acetylneuraminic acid mutarotase